jgi:hypothetical protein
VNKILQVFIGALTLAACASASAQQVATPKPKVYALISAVGDQFTMVTQKQSVGSNMLDHYRRDVFKVPGNMLNTSILKGLDRAIEQKDPSSIRILATLNALEMEGVRPLDRERIAMGKLLSALEKMPQRAEWDTIIVVTPKYQYSARKGMGSKLEGIGIYIQPLESNRLSSTDGVEILGTEGEEETINPEGKPGKRSSRFVAPYNYTQTWVFDAKTLKVLETSARYEFQRIYDPESTALDIAKSIPPEKMAELLTKFVERSVARGVGEALPTVEIGEVTPVAAGTPKPKS